MTFYPAQGVKKMGDFYEKVDADLDPLQRLLERVPGFGGYMERKKRRDADKLLRQTIANRFDELYQRISQVQREVINQGQIRYVDDIEAAAIKIRTFIDLVRTASYGYSSFFDAAKVDEDALRRMYEYDLQMLTLVEEIGRAIDNVEASIGSDGLPAAIRHLVGLARQCVDTFNRREETITSVG